MSVHSLLWLLTLSLGVQSAAPLALDVRVFRGSTEVTRETKVTVFAAGTRTNGRDVPLIPSGERQLSLGAGQYDLQMVQHQDGKVGGIAWTTLRLLVGYPGENGRHLEVLNFDKSWGALQLREYGSTVSGAPAWSARLLRKDGTEVARSVAGDGYHVIVAPAGMYDLAIAGARTPMHLRDVEVKANLTETRVF
jgi:hypothetical protein